jgi:hypothetical protein
MSELRSAGSPTGHFGDALTPIWGAKFRARLRKKIGKDVMLTKEFPRLLDCLLSVFASPQTSKFPGGSRTR